MNSYWKNIGLLFVVSIGIDYWIATQLASRNEEVWFFFILLILIPMFFLFKSAVIRLFVWYFVQKNENQSQILAYLRKNELPKPDEFEVADLNGPEDYLNRLMEEGKVSNQKKYEIAKTLGVIHTMNQTQQIVAKFIWSKDFLFALKRYGTVG